MNRHLLDNSYSNDTSNYLAPWLPVANLLFNLQLFLRENLTTRMTTAQFAQKWRRRSETTFVISVKCKKIEQRLEALSETPLDLQEVTNVLDMKHVE